MCLGCWDPEEHKFHASSLVVHGARLANQVQGSSNLHGFIEDGNVEDHNLDFGEEMIASDRESPPEKLADELACVKFFRKLTVDERRSALLLQELAEWYGDGRPIAPEYLEPRKK